MTSTCYDNLDCLPLVGELECCPLKRDVYNAIGEKQTSYFYSKFVFYLPYQEHI